ncbi:MAG: hypothetical protein AAFO07_26405 [Bacteroidota bacterium]
MKYQITIKPEKAAAFYQMLNAMRALEVIEYFEIVEATEQDSNSSTVGGEWEEASVKDRVTQEMIKKYSDLVDLD